MATKDKKSRTAREERHGLQVEINILRAQAQTIALALNALAEKIDAPEIMERVRPVLLEIAASQLDGGLTMGANESGS